MTTTPINPPAGPTAAQRRAAYQHQIEQLSAVLAMDFERMGLWYRRIEVLWGTLEHDEPSPLTEHVEGTFQYLAQLRLCLILVSSHLDSL